MFLGALAGNTALSGFVYNYSAYTGTELIRSEIGKYKSVTIIAITFIRLSASFSLSISAAISLIPRVISFRFEVMVVTAEPTVV